MGQTEKHSARQKTRRAVLEVFANGDGTYKAIFNERLVGGHIPEAYLEELLCVKYGYCGEEYDSILRQLAEHGRANMTDG